MLHVNLYDTPTPNGNRNTIGNASLEFTVPAMEGDWRSDEPLDLGVITAKLLEVLEPGAIAPNPSLARPRGWNDSNGQPQRQLVLLSFMQAERGADLSGLAALKRIHEQFGKDPNFVMVTVWCGYDTESIKQSLAASGLGWPQAAVHHLYAQQAQEYKVRTLPTTYLIGSNGKVMPANAKEEDLKKSIDSLLSLGELFLEPTKSDK